jgi:hypothetical protein
MPRTSHDSIPSEPTPLPAFTRVERASLRHLRARYAAGHDLLSASELARLLFVRWLYLTGRLAS